MTNGDILKFAKNSIPYTEICVGNFIGFVDDKLCDYFILDTGILHTKLIVRIAHDLIIRPDDCNDSESKMVPVDAFGKPTSSWDDYKLYFTTTETAEIKKHILYLSKRVKELTNEIRVNDIKDMFK